MTNNELKGKFKVSAKTGRDFIRWAEGKGFKVHDATVSRHLAGTQSITEPWGIAYTCFFEQIKNKSEMKKGVVNEIKGGYRAYYNDDNIKDFLFKDFETGSNCLNAAYKFLNDCKEQGLEAFV